jgi:hypothetical protein
MSDHFGWKSVATIEQIPAKLVMPLRTVGLEAKVIDHAGFRLDDYDGTPTKLDALAIRYQTRDLGDLNERRLFNRTPRGILLELVFRESPLKQP